MKNASFLKASCAVLLAVMVLLGCALPAFAEAEHDPDSLVWESEAETAGEVKATRTYLLQNAMDSVVTELYVYPSAGTDKGENTRITLCERVAEIFLSKILLKSSFPVKTKSLPHPFFPLHPRFRGIL